MITIDKLRKNFGEKVAVNIEHYEINQGDMLGLVGNNGAGKTTTMQTVSGLIGMGGVRGEIWFDGKRIDRKKGNKITAMGLSQVLEGRHVFHS